MTEMMKAAVLVGPEKIETKLEPVPEMKAGDIRICVSATGVCGSDIHMWKTGKGWNPKHKGDFWMGHEFCGVVEDPGTSDFEVGDRVVFWANLYCGECDMCRAGQEHLCREVNGTNYIGFVCNGAYAEKFVGPARLAYKLPDTVSDVDAALIDPLMVAYHAVHLSNMKLHDKVLVVGSGIIAQLMGDLAKTAGASLVAMSKTNDRKLAKAREMGKFDCYLDGKDPNRRAVYEEVSKGGFDVVFEAVGNESALAAAMDAVKAGGTIVTVGNTIDPTIPFDINRLVLHEIRLVGSVSCTRKEFEETIDLIASGMIKPERYVTDIVPVEGMQKAFERLTSRTDPVLKIVMKPDAQVD